MKKLLHLLFLILFFVCQSCLTGRKAFDPDRKFPLKELQSDYTLFREILEKNHPSLYWYTSRDSINYFFDRGYAALTDSMTEPQFKTLLSFVISRINCGHTSVMYSKKYSAWLDTVRRAQFPLVVKCWKDTMVIALNLNRGDTVLRRGVIIKKINGYPVTALMDTLFNYIVSDGYNLTGKYQYLSTGLNFSSWYRNVFGFSPTFIIDYVDRDSTVKQALLPLYDRHIDTVRKLYAQELYARHEPRKKRREMDAFLARSLQVDTGSHTAFMTLNTFENGNQLVKFFRESFKTLDEMKIPNLVIDVRSNGGGDATNSTLLTRYIIDKKFKLADSLYAVTRHSKYDGHIQNSFLYRVAMEFVTVKRSDGKYHFWYYENRYFKPKEEYHYNGQVYILIGGNSFSATTLFAGALKGQKNVTLVGEETGGGYYGNTAWMIPEVTLPGTRVRFRLPRFRLVIDKNREKNGLGVQPDVLVLPTADAIGKGLDFKAEKAKELIDLSNAQKK